MKTTKLILTALAAVGLMASSVSAYEENFELYELDTVMHSVEGWTSSADEPDDESKVVAVDGGKALELNTQGETLSAAVEEDFDGNYFSGTVKFVPHSSEVAIDDPEAKVAVYAFQEDDGEDIDLVIYHGVYNKTLSTVTTHIPWLKAPVAADPEGGVEEVKGTLDQINDTHTLKISMKAFDENLYEGKSPYAFKVELDEVLIESANGYSEGRIGDDTWRSGPDGGPWFVSACANAGVADTISAICFKGTGLVDDLKIASAVTFVAEVGGVQYETFAEAVDAANGAPITLLADCSYDFVAGKPFSVDEGDYKLTVTGTYAIDENGVYCDAVASIGTAYYASLPAAFAAANAAVTPSTITLLANCDVTATGLVIEDDKDVTLDLNGFSIKARETRDENILVLGKLTLKDTVANSNGMVYTEDTYVKGVSDFGLIRVDGGEFVMLSGKIYTVIADDTVNNGQFGIVMYGDSPKVTLNGGTVESGWYAVTGNGTEDAITGEPELVVDGATLISRADYAIYWPNIGTTTVDSGIVYGEAGAICAQQGSIEINGGTITSNGQGDTGTWGDGTGNLGKAAIYVNAKYGDTALTVTGGTITANGDAINIASGTAYEATVEVSGGIFNKPVADAYCAAGFKPADNGDGTYGVVEYKTLTFVTAYGTAPEAQKLADDEPTVEPEDPTAEGYDFVAWFTDDGTFESAFVFGGTISEDTTVYGSWTEHVQYVAEVDGTQYATFADAVDAANGAPITLLANCSYEFVAGKPFSVVEGDYKLTVTGVYAIDENGVYCDPVASIGTAYYASLPAAFAAANAAETATTIKLLADCDVTARIDVANDVTLDLNGKTVEYVADSLYTSGVFGVLYGAKFTVDDTSDGAKGVIDGTMCYAAVSVTTKQDKDNTANGTAELVVKNGTLQGHYYGITGNGQRHNTAVTVEGGTVKGLNDVEDEDGSFGIYNPQNGTLTIKGGVVQGQSGVGVKAGTVSVVDGGEIIATRTTTQAYAYQGSGVQCTGDAFVIDSCGYPGGDPEVEISGGTFTAAAGKPIASYTTQDDPKYPTATEERIENFVSGGTFNKALDEAYCATGFMPVENDDGTFGVAEYYTLTFVTAHGDAPEAQKLLADDVTVKPDDPTAEDYAFGGWFTDDGTFATAFVFGNTISEDTTVYAKWTSTKKFSGGTGTEADPYLISCVKDLQDLDADVDAGTSYAGSYFLQTKNIDFADVTDWSGIGTVGGTGKAFSGIYDGGNKAIANLTTTSTVNYSGILFHNLDNGELKNLTVNVNVNQGGGFGLIGGASYTTVSNVTVTGTIMGNHHTGGFVAFGQWSDNAVTFVDCTNEANVASSKSAAGFYGKPQNNNATFVRCVNKGTIGASGKMGGDGGLGGFITGFDGYGTYEDCVNEGVVLGGFGQFARNGVGPVTGTLKARADQYAGTLKNGTDGLNFGVLPATEAGIITLVKNADVALGGEYKVMTPIASLPVAFTEADQTISFDLALNGAFRAEVTATGVEVETNLVDGVSVTYTAKAVQQGYESQDKQPIPDDIVAWAKGSESRFGEYIYADIEKAYLLNLDFSKIEEVEDAYTFTVSDITVGDQVLVTVELDRGEYGLGAINGKLVLKGKAELANEWADVDTTTFAEGAFSTDTTEEFTFDVDEEKFFKAEITK